jgi:site-specific DNA-methyltransferase (adenine-specific)
VAKKLGRRWLGFELSENYADKIEARLSIVEVGQRLDGAEEPRVSAPATPANGKRKRAKSAREPEATLDFPE